MSIEISKTPKTNEIEKDIQPSKIQASAAKFYQELKAKYGHQPEEETKNNNEYFFQ